MNTAVPPPAVLPVAYHALRLLIVLNWLMGAAILALLLVMPNERWIMSAFQLTPSPEAARLVMGLRAIALVGLLAIPVHYAYLTRLLAIVQTVRAGDPFVAANAARPAEPGDRRVADRRPRRAAHLRAGAGVRGGHAAARRSRGDGLTCRLP